MAGSCQQTAVMSLQSILALLDEMKGVRRAQSVDVGSQENEELWLENAEKLLCTSYDAGSENFAGEEQVQGYVRVSEIPISQFPSRESAPQAPLRSSSSQRIM